MNPTCEMLLEGMNYELFPTGPGTTDTDRIEGAIAVMIRDFHQNADLYVLQRRCETLSRMLRDPQAVAIVDWLAIQAELIDCRLIAGSKDELNEPLTRLIRFTSSSGQTGST